MLSIGLWRWYIKTTITILAIINRPVFYLTLNWTLYVCQYLTRKTLRLRYKPNRLMLSICLWRWNINITITSLDTEFEYEFEFEFEFFLRPTVRRPVRLGIGPPFGILDQILSHSSSFVWQLRRFAINTSSLTRKRVCNLLELEFFLRPTVSRPVCLGIGPLFGILGQILSCSSSFV
jgi:hypothetical protein